MRNRLIILLCLFSFSGLAQEEPGLPMVVNSIQQTVKARNHNDSIINIFNDAISFKYYYDSCLIEKIDWKDTTSHYMKTTSFEQLDKDCFLHRGTAFDGKLPISLVTFMDDDFQIFAIHVFYWVFGPTEEEDIFMKVEHIIEKQY